MNKKNLLFVAIILFVITVVSATPLVDFSTLTPANNNHTQKTTIELTLLLQLQISVK